MSIDLRCWYISNRKYVSREPPESLSLYPPGANISNLKGWDFWQDDTTEVSFQQQLDLVLEFLKHHDEELLEEFNLAEPNYINSFHEFRKEAKEFETRAKLLGKPIRSYWL